MGYSNFANDQNVEFTRKGGSHFISNGHSTSWQSKDQRVDRLMSHQIVGQSEAGLTTICEPHRYP
jgi:hypothetical protein